MKFVGLTTFSSCFPPRPPQVAAISLNQWRFVGGGLSDCGHIVTYCWNGLNLEKESRQE
jgi:hypothetical protein